MYKKILLAYDGSPDTEVALAQATNLARKFKAELHLVGIARIALAPTAYAEPYPHDFLAGEKEQISEALKAACEDIGKSGLHASATILEGSPSARIAELAHAMNADLVVIGHTDKGLLARLFEGSVGTELVRNLPCSLLIAT